MKKTMSELKKIWAQMKAERRKKEKDLKKYYRNRHHSWRKLHSMGEV